MSKGYYKIIEESIAKGASDIHIFSEQPTRIFINNCMISLADSLKQEDLIEFLLDNKVLLADNNSRDFGFSVGDVRCRGNAYKTANGDAVAIRVLSKSIPTYDSLNMVPQIRAISELHSGLVLIAGETGMGKTTTLASIINDINFNKKYHIITIEDPIEYKFIPNQSIISQREVHTHCDSFAQAARDSMRQNPDVVMIGEIRDADTVLETIRLGQSGCLTLASVHSASVTGAIDRMCNLFPEAMRSTARAGITEVTKCIVHQLLVPTKSGELLLAPEIMYRTPSLTGALFNNAGLSMVRDLLRMNHDGLCIHRADAIRGLMKNNKLDLDFLKSHLSEEDYNFVVRG